VYLGADVHRGMGTAQGSERSGYVTLRPRKNQVVERRSGRPLSVSGRRAGSAAGGSSWNFESVRPNLGRRESETRLHRSKRFRGSAPHLLHALYTPCSIQNCSRSTAATTALSMTRCTGGVRTRLIRCGDTFRAENSLLTLLARTHRRGCRPCYRTIRRRLDA